MKGKVIDTGMRSAQENMDIDGALLEDVCSEPLLHFYEWERDALSHGHFLAPEKNLVTVEGLDIAKRPTGGGMLFHIADFAFSLIIPKDHPSFSFSTLDRYAFINERVKKALSPFFASALFQDKGSAAPSFCMTKPTVYDLMVGGKKVAGSAQRKRRAGYLHQASINVGLLSKEFLRKYLAEALIDQMHQVSFAPLGTSWTKNELEEGRAYIKELLSSEFVDF